MTAAQGVGTVIAAQAAVDAIECGGGGAAALLYLLTTGHPWLAEIQAWLPLWLRDSG